MRVLWLCNIMLPAIGESLGLPYSNKEGWLTGAYERINAAYGKEEGARTVTALGVCFPTEKIIPERMGEKGSFQLGATCCYAFEEKLAAPEIYDAGLEERFAEILADFQPDMVHIFGTEFPHTLAMVRAYGRPERTLIGLQGICAACADAYMADIPEYVQNRVTLRDYIKKDDIRRQQEKFRIRGKHEREAVRSVGHITGRTAFDREETMKINKSVRYHPMNETMRASFYTGEWRAENAVPYSIFLSQGDYPLKGFHYMLHAMPRIMSRYPEACLYVAGNSIISNRTIKDKLKLSSYGKYLLELIAEYRLEEKVVMTGRLSGEAMKRQYLKSSVFVCPSAVENSPNSLGEAMLLGVPAVAADTGGISSMLEDKREGLLYEAGNVCALADAVIAVWDEPEKALKRAKEARRRAIETHDADRNYERLLGIYREICQ